MTSSDFTFESLVRNYREPLTKAAYHLCGDRDAACDIVQETLLSAYRGFGSLRAPEKAGAWLYAILRRKALAHRRRRRPDVMLVEPSVPGPEDAGSLVRGLLVEQMRRLSEEDREILAGKYLMGLSYRELADSLGVKEGAIRVRCFRAKERLREVLNVAGVSLPESARTR